MGSTKQSWLYSIMNIADQRTYRRHRENRTAIGEILFVMLAFASMGAITWAIRGTSGWGGIDGTIVPGMTWGMLWWYICWRKGINAGAVPLWLVWESRSAVSWAMGNMSRGFAVCST
jgi:hypothetical protein